MKCEHSISSSTQFGLNQTGSNWIHILFRNHYSGNKTQQPNLIDYPSIETQKLKVYESNLIIFNSTFFNELFQSAFNEIWLNWIRPSSAKIDQKKKQTNRKLAIQENSIIEWN